MKRKIVTQELIYAYKYILFFIKNNNKIETKKNIAEKENLPLNFITKITAKLKQAGILNSFPGNSGGNNLAKLSDEITVADLIIALHGDNYIEECFEGSNKEFGNMEKINSFFGSIQKEITKRLKNTTLAEVIENKDQNYFKFFEIHENIEKEEIEDIKEQAKKEQAKIIAKNLLEVLTIEMISKKTGLTLQEIEALKA